MTNTSFGKPNTWPLWLMLWFLVKTKAWNISAGFSESWLSSSMKLQEQLTCTWTCYAASGLIDFHANRRGWCCQPRWGSLRGGGGGKGIDLAASPDSCSRTLPPQSQSATLQTGKCLNRLSFKSHTFSSHPITPQRRLLLSSKRIDAL